MSWEDRRTSGAVGTAVAAVRGTAHADDAKHRSDESTALRTRARALSPAVILAAVVLLLVGGGVAAAVVASHGDGPGHRAAGGSPSAAPSPTPGKASPSSPTGAAADGSVRGTVVLTGTSTFRQLPFHDNPGTAPVSTPATMGFACDATTCTVQDPTCPTSTLARSGAGYRARTVTRKTSSYGPLVDTTTCSLVVSGGQATYSVSNTGAYQGTDADHYEQVNPQSTTLTGKLTLTP
jgi:hypothetical protein